VTQTIGERHARLDIDTDLAAIDFELSGHVTSHQLQPAPMRG
jgi:hypothetical protein